MSKELIRLVKSAELLFRKEAERHGYAPELWMENARRELAKHGEVFFGGATGSGSGTPSKT
jgi:hypothetical protein